jgi:hypothetical protein
MSHFKGYFPLLFFVLVGSWIRDGQKCESGTLHTECLPVLRNRIRRIHMFLGLPDPDPLVRDTDPDPSIVKQNCVRKTLIPTV